MIRKSLLSCLTATILAMMFAPSASAQSVDISGGYAFLHEEDLNVPAGWYAAVGGDINKWLGVVGQVSGNYKTVSESGLDVKTNMHIFGAGPRVSSSQNPAFTPFGQVLFGAARVGASVSGVPNADFSDTKFAVQPAGGADIRLTGRVGLRLQVAGTFISVDDETLKEFQFMVGIVFRSGSR